MIQPQEIRERVRDAREAAGSQPWVVAYDVNAIQDLITACGRPVSMRGASETITRFDRWALDRKLTVFAGGGRGISLASSEQLAQELARKFERQFRDMTLYGVIATAWVPLDRGAEAQSLRWLRHLLELKKDAAETPTPALPTQRDLECVHCGRYDGSVLHKRDDGEERVCRRCHKMIEAGKEAGEMRTSLEVLAEEGRIAAVSADGNNLRALFESLRSLEELAAVSQAVASIFTDAHKQALKDIPHDKRLPLLTGGDDVRAFLAPSCLLTYVETLAAAIERETETHLRDIRSLVQDSTAKELSRLGIGIGAVVGPLYFPAWRVMEYAHELERHAKSARRAQSGASPRSMIDFAIITNEATITADIAGSRSRRDIRPLSLDGETWQRTLDQAAALDKIPSTQLNLLALAPADEHLDNGEAAADAEAGNADQAEFANLFRYQVARTPAWRRWYEHCGVNWRDPREVIERRPDRGLLELQQLRTL